MFQTKSKNMSKRIINKLVIKHNLNFFEQFCQDVKKRHLPCFSNSDESFPPFSVLQDISKQHKLNETVWETKVSEKNHHKFIQNSIHYSKYRMSCLKWKNQYHYKISGFAANNPLLLIPMLNLMYPNTDDSTKIKLQHFLNDMEDSFDFEIGFHRYVLDKSSSDWETDIHQDFTKLFDILCKISLDDLD